MFTCGNGSTMVFLCVYIGAFAAYVPGCAADYRLSPITELTALMGSLTDADPFHSLAGGNTPLLLVTTHHSTGNPTSQKNTHTHV